VARLGLVLVVVSVLLAALVAVRRDPRITGGELRAQGLLLAGYAAVAAGIGWLTLSRMDDGAWLAGGGLAFALWLVVALPLLARHLARRLDKPGR
jgi:hypothetical protein